MEKAKRNRAKAIREREWEKRKDMILALRRQRPPFRFFANILDEISEEGFEPTKKQLRRMLDQWAKDEMSEQGYLPTSSVPHGPIDGQALPQIQPQQYNAFSSINVPAYNTTGALSTQYYGAVAVSPTGPLPVGYRASPHLSGMAIPSVPHETGFGSNEREISSVPHSGVYSGNAGFVSMSPQSTVFPGYNTAYEGNNENEAVAYDGSQIKEEEGEMVGGLGISGARGGEEYFQSRFP